MPALRSAAHSPGATATQRRDAGREGLQRGSLNSTTTVSAHSSDLGRAPRALLACRRVARQKAQRCQKALRRGPGSTPFTSGVEQRAREAES